MPRARKPPRLWLRKRDTGSVWVILDNGRHHATGCGQSDREGAERSLARYLSNKYQPPTRESALDRIAVADVVNIYLREHAPHVRNPEFLLHTASPIIEWWGNKALSEIRGQTCRSYVQWRCARGVSDQTARHDIKTLRAAIHYYHREYGPLQAVPALTMPAKSAPKDRWLTRSEAARFVRIAYRTNERVLRLLLLGLYTGTRRDALMRLRWVPSLDRGWIDIEAGLIYRAGRAEAITDKRRPPCPIPSRLRQHLEIWRAADMINGWIDVMHYDGRASRSIKRSWATVRATAGISEDVTPHTLRHTCVTWLMQRGVPVAEVAGFVGMSIEMVDRVYVHHHPDFMRKAKSF